MKTSGTRWGRLALLAAAGALVFVLVMRSGSGDNDIVQPVIKSASVGATDNAPAKSATERSAERAPEAPDVPSRAQVAKSAKSDPFAAKGWLPPPPPPPPPPAPVAPPPPPPPMAPPVPYKFIGQIEDKSAKPAAFITKGDALFVVHVGDVIENTYRIESFNSAQVVITYLPLKQQQTIDVSGG